MKKVFIYIFLVLIGLFATCQYSYAQSINQITGRCAGTLLYSKIEVQRLGDINAAPCSGHTFNINGSPIPSGTGTNIFLPIWTGTNTLSSSPLSWNSTTYNFNNTALNSEFTLDLVPSTTVGRFRVGDCITTLTNCIDLDQNTNSFTVNTVGAIGFASTTSGVSFSTVTQTDFVTGGAFTVTSINGNTLFDISNSNNSFTVLTGTGITNFTTSQFQLSSSLALPQGGSKCAGTSTLGAGGTVSVVATDCLQDTDAVILITYNNTGIANVLPASATRTGVSGFDVRGDANATFNYFIVDRF